MAAKSEPVHQFGRGARNIGTGNADFRKPEFLPPVFDFAAKGDDVDRPLGGLRSACIGVFLLHSLNHSVVGGRTSLSVSLPDEAASIDFGRQLAPCLKPGMVVWFDGDLGAGKTTLVRALLRGLGHAGPVKSPTYTLVEVYVLSSIYWYHFDFYRFNEPEEFEDAGLGEYFREDAVCLVEWPEKAAGHVPQPDITLILRFADVLPESGRTLTLLANSEAGQQCLSTLKHSWLLADR